MTAAAGSGQDADEVRALTLLSTAYAAAADGGDGDALAALFVPDGQLVVPDVPRDLRPVITRTGTEALRAIPGRLAHYVRTFHVTSDHRFTIDGGRASGEIQCVAHHLTAPTDDAPGTDTVWYIRYRDRYVRTGDGWRIERRELHLQWVEERPVTVVATDPTT